MSRISLTAVAWALVACTPGLNDPGDEARNQLLSRASFDLACPRSQLHTVTIDDRTVGVRGCDQRGTYVATCDESQFGFYPQCTWVMNSSRHKHQEDE